MLGGIGWSGKSPLSARGQSSRSPTADAKASARRGGGLASSSGHEVVVGWAAVRFGASAGRSVWWSAHVVMSSRLSLWFRSMSFG